MLRQSPLAATILAAVLQTQSAGPVTLELRVFHGAEEVTRHVRATVHRAGDRGEPVAQRHPTTGSLEFSLPEGLYDAQVFHEVDGKVLDIRWANRLVVMRYPDEGGRHLEVVNFQNGYGALQVRVSAGSQTQISIYQTGRRDRPAAEPIVGPGYMLFVVRGGLYDLQAREAGTTAWHSAIEVPVDRTRFWVVPETD